MTTLIKNAIVVDPSQNINQKINILIDNGKIKELTQQTPQADSIIDAAGLYASPGIVDLHVHLRDPGQTDKEDIITGTNAAAAGGVTSLLAMPNTVPTIDSFETVQYVLNKAKTAKSHVYIAGSITKGLKSEEKTDILALKQAGVTALTDDGRPVINTAFMADALVKANQLGLTVVSHCEDLYLAKGGIINKGKISAQLGVTGIPKSAEDVGTARDITLAESYGAKIHICHVSTKTSVDIIKSAKARGVQVTCETAPHYFSLTEEQLLKKDADYRMNPPLREEIDKQAIILGLQDGTIDAIATDHAPHTVQEKADFIKSPNGSIGMETSFAVGLTYLVNTGKLSLSQLIEKMSCTPAKILGINGGTLKNGSPADIILYDTEKTWTVDTARLHGKSQNTPFKNMELKGKIITTLLDGAVVYENKD